MFPCLTWYPIRVATLFFLVYRAHSILSMLRTAMTGDLLQILQVTSWMFQDLTQQQQQHLITVDTAFQNQMCQSLLPNESQTEVPISIGRGDVLNPRENKKKGFVPS